MKYLSQRDIYNLFKSGEVIEKDVYISFVGYYKIPGYHMSSTGFSIIEPKKIILKFEDNIFMEIFDLFQDDEIENKNSSFSKLLSTNPYDDTLYPLNNEIDTSFTQFIKAFSENNTEIEFDGELINSLKFFETLEEAELNFIKMMKVYLEKKDLVHALSTYNEIIDKHETINPSELLKHM